MPSDYLREIVLPTFEEFNQKRLSRRLAYLVCMVIFHLKDHLKNAGAIKVEETMHRDAPIAFDVVRAVCNGTKHVETDNSHPIAFRAGDDWDRPPAFCGVMVAGISVLGDLKGGRDIRQGHARIDIYEACRQTLETFKKNYSSQLM